MSRHHHDEDGPPAEAEQLSSTTHTQTPDGLWNVATTTTTTTTTVITPAKVPPPSGIVIPPNAKTSGILDAKTNWKQEKDAGTPGSASNISNHYIDANNGRNFHADYQNHGGVRWSNTCANTETATNFVYDLEVMASDWKGMTGQLELDINQSMADGTNIFLCTQANFNAGCWDYTLTPSGKCHWYHSTIAVKPFAPNAWVHIQIETSRDANYIVTYKNIAIDGVATPFESSAKGVSAFHQGWGAGKIINNYQTNGAQTSGTMDTFSRNMQVWYW